VSGLSAQPLSLVRRSLAGSTLTDGLFTTGPIGALPYPRTTYTLRFPRPGTYTYLCTFHPGMTGMVEVR
jgi:hypothetical protein